MPFTASSDISRWWSLTKQTFGSGLVPAKCRLVLASYYSLFTLRKPYSPVRINGERGFLGVDRLYQLFMGQLRNKNKRCLENFSSHFQGFPMSLVKWCRAYLFCISPKFIRLQVWFLIWNRLFILEVHYTINAQITHTRVCSIVPGNRCLVRQILKS